jgi:hypothetical protein
LFFNEYLITENLQNLGLYEFMEKYNWNIPTIAAEADVTIYILTQQ